MSAGDACREKLLEEMGRLDVVDAHEHLVPERVHLETEYTFFHLFIPYVQYDLASVGMPKQWLGRPPGSPQEVEQYWRVIRTLWPQVKHGSYARVLLLALRRFWNIDDLTDDSYLRVGRAMNETRTAGHYRRVLAEECRIRFVINNKSIEERTDPPVFKTGYNLKYALSPEELGRFARESPPGATIDDCLARLREDVRSSAAAGGVFVKFDASWFADPPDRSRAGEQFEGLQRAATLGKLLPIGSYVGHALLEDVAALNLVASVHTGVWNNVYQSFPRGIFDVVAAHPDVTFDIYHMGMPFVRACGFLAKNHPNAWLNLCWSHIVSPRMTVNGLEEWLDYVPVSKVLGFGGDYIRNPENVWAHLHIARQNLAEVFQRAIRNGSMSFEGALEVLKMWLYDNPVRLYRLSEAARHEDTST